MTSAPDPIRPLLSLLIPAYNEEKRLPASLDKILAWRETVPYDVEIVIIENGSSDATTAVAEAYAASHPNATSVAQAPQPGDVANEQKNVAIIQRKLTEIPRQLG